MGGEDRESHSYVPYSLRRDSKGRTPEQTRGFLTLSFYVRYSKSKHVRRRTVLQEYYYKNLESRDLLEKQVLAVA